MKTKIYTKFFLYCLLFSAFEIFSNQTTAQLATLYPVANCQISTGTYVDLATNGSVISTANTDDALSGNVPIGFSFKFNNSLYDSFTLSTNGWIKMGQIAASSSALFYSAPQSSGAGTGGVFNSTTSTDSNFIVPFMHDLVGASGAEYRVFTSGTTPNRICTIQFKNLTEKNTSIAVQYTNINFQIKLYESTNIIEFIYGSWTMSTSTSAFRSAGVGLKGSSSSATQLVTITKGSTQAWNLAGFLSGNYTGNAFNYGNNVGTARPGPVSGVTYRFIPKAQRDIAVPVVYTLGKLPIPYANPHSIRASISNVGFDTAFNLKAYLNITGANNLSDSILISQLNPSASLIISFPNALNFANVGYDTVRVFVPNDSNNSNNISQILQIVNLNTYSYADQFLGLAGGVGFTGGTGDFVAKFQYTGSNAINQIGVNFATGGVSLKVAIWDTTGTGGNPGTVLWSSTSFTSTSGVNTIPVNPPISITGSFYVGVQQIGTTNASFAFQNENPIRTGTFYYTSPTGGTTWTDFASSASPYRFMIEPRLQIANDVGVTLKLFPCAALVQNSPAFSAQARINNFGAVGQFSPFKVRYSITGPVNFVDSTTTTVAANSTVDITFPHTFNPTTVGTYTIKIYTELASDGDRTNDTLTSTFVINALAYGNTAVNRLQFDGVDDYLSVPDATSLNPLLGITLEGWVNPTNFTTNRPIFSKDTAKSAAGREYTLYLNTSGYPVFVLHTSGSTDSLISSVPVSTGVMTHVAAVYSGNSSTMKLFINGDTAGSKTMSGVIQSMAVPLNIGKFQSTSVNELFLGQLDELKIWDTARTQTQIQAGLHTRLSNIPSAHVVMYLRLDEGTGTNITTDASGNCNSASLNNMDFNNTSWVTSKIPLGTPLYASQNITTSGTSVFTGANLQMTSYNFSGNQTYGVHYFSGQPLGTLPSTSPGGVTNVYNNYWIIYKYGGATFDSIYARYSFAGGTLLASAATAADVKLFNRNNSDSSGWTLVQAGANNISVPSQYATFKFTGSTTFNKQFSVGANNGSLPVELISFDAIRDGRNANINWSTANEINNKYFAVERSFDNQNFTETGRVDGAKNGKIANKYLFIDRDAQSLNQLIIYYRLKQVDADGQFTFTNIISVKFNDKINHVTSVVPNPFENNLTVSFNSENVNPVKVKMMNLNGQVVVEKTINTEVGSNKWSIDESSNLTPGVYFISLVFDNEVSTYKVIKMK